MANVPNITLNNGKTIPQLGLGTWKSKENAVYEAVKYAILHAGYRHIDTAWIYRNEVEIGRALKEVLETGQVKREEIFVTSKLWNTMHSKAAVAEGIQLSLKNLGLDYLDLFLIHWPMGYKEGDELFPEDANGNIIDSGIDYFETWSAMETLVEAGLVRSIGVSNFNAVQLDRVLAQAKIKPVMNQIEVHAYLNNAALIEHCKAKNVAVTAYSPLGSPDRPWAKPGEPALLEDPKVKTIADARGKSVAQVLLRYAVQRGLVVIPKSVTPSRITANIQLFDFELSSEEMATLEGFTNGWRVCLLDNVAKHPYYPF